MKSLIVWILIIFMTIPVQFGQTNERQIQILFVNSYDRDNEWTRSMEEGFIHSIENEGIAPKYYFEYLSSKDFIGEVYFENVKTLLMTKYKDKKIDAIVTTDDDATLFMYKNKSEMFNDPPPLIYCGVNNEYNFKGDTYGVLENIEIGETIKLIQKIQGNETKILIVTDETSASYSILKLNQIEMILKQNTRIELVQSSNKKKIVDRLDNKNYEAVIFLLFNRDDEGNCYTYKQGYEFFESDIDVPVYGTWEFYLGRGILGGKMVSGREQGQEASRLMSNLLRGKVQKEGSVKIENRYYFDDRVLKRFSLNEKSIPAGATVLYKPINYFEENKEILFIASIIVSLLISIILIMYWIMKKQFKQLQTANENILELRQIESLMNITVSMSHEINTNVGNAITLISLGVKESSALKIALESGQLTKPVALESLGLLEQLSNESLKNLEKSAQFIERIKEGVVPHLFRHFEDFDPAELLNSFINNEKHRLEECHVECVVKNVSEQGIDQKEPLLFYGSQQDWMDILKILLDNALTHAFQDKKMGGAIAIELNIKADSLILDFNDNGKGIPQEILPHIFDPLYKADLATEGEGLGLFRVKQSIHFVYCGQITCLSEVGKGTQFHIVMYKRRKVHEKDQH